MKTLNEALIGPAGPPGPTGPLGGRRVTIQNFNVPAINDGVTIRIDRLDFVAGQWVHVAGFGPALVTDAGYDVPGGFNFITVTNTGRLDNAAPGTLISTGAVVMTAGVPAVGGGELERFIDAPAETFSGAHRVVTGSPWPSSVCWYTDNTLTLKIFEVLYTRNGAQQATTITQRRYAPDGVTVQSTATDTVTYSAGVEATRTRVIT